MFVIWEHLYADVVQPHNHLLCKDSWLCCMECWCTSKESPEMTRAQSCFLLKAFSSRWASPLFDTCSRAKQYYCLMYCIMKTAKYKNKQTKKAYCFKNMNILASGDQMGAFCYACSCFEFVPCQHPDLKRKKKMSLRTKLFKNWLLLS